MGTARTKANNRWNAKAYDRVNLTMPQGRKAEIKAHAEARGESTNGFINRSISGTIERDISGIAPVSSAPIGDMLCAEALKAIHKIVRTTGESVAEYVNRAVLVQSKRDETGISLGVNPVTGEAFHSDEGKR